MDVKKCRALVQYVTLKERPVTAKELAAFLNFSVRSVKSYVSEINEGPDGVILVSGHSGYTANKQTAAHFLRTHAPQTEAPQSYEERAVFINRQFLTYRTDTIPLEELAEELHYSEETIKADLQKMNRSFAHMGVSYELHSDGVRLVADERSLRRLARATLFNESDGRMMDYDTIQNVFQKQNIPAVRRQLEEALQQYELYVNDFGMVNMVLHLALILQRVENNKVLTLSTSIAYDPQSAEYRAAECLCAGLEQTLGANFSREEKENIYLLIRANANASPNLGNTDIQQYVGDETMLFVRDVVRTMDYKYHVTLSNDTFMLPFAMHIKNLVLRAREHRTNLNPMVDVIRYSHPMVFDMAVMVATMVNETYRVHIDENEISYLALHIGGELDRQKSAQEKVRAVLLSPKYLELSGKLYNQLLIRFGDEMDLLAGVNTPDELKNYKFDLLLTTVSVNAAALRCRVVSIPYVGLSGKLAEIETAIEDVREDRQMRILKEDFGRFFSEDLFFLCREENPSAFGIMRTMADKMAAAGVVQDNFYDQLLERELAATTAFPNIAIPHSMKLDAVKTCVGVMLVPQGVAWGGQRVRIVLVMAINKIDVGLFGELYQALIRLLDNEANLEKVVSKTNFADFAEQLKRMI